MMNQFKGWYCNIGKPAIIEDDFISYVDLALDLWVSANGEQTVLDEDELDALNLDDDLKQKAYDGLKELQQLIKQKILRVDPEDFLWAIYEIQ